MATYTDLRSLWSDDVLRNRIELAQTVVSNEILVQTDALPANHTARVKWAVLVMTSPASWADIMLRLLIARNNTLTIQQLKDVADADLATAIRGAVDSFANNL